jgi:hypothetical protein
MEVLLTLALHKAHIFHFVNVYSLKKALKHRATRAFTTCSSMCHIQGAFNSVCTVLYNSSCNLSARSWAAPVRSTGTVWQGPSITYVLGQSSSLRPHWSQC